MIKSKRKTTVFARKPTKATWFLDSFHNWDYKGNSKKLGEKYKSNNNYVYESGYHVNKTLVQGIDLSDA